MLGKRPTLWLPHRGVILARWQGGLPQHVSEFIHPVRHAGHIARRQELVQIDESKGPVEHRGLLLQAAVSLLLLYTVTESAVTGYEMGWGSYAVIYMVGIGGVIAALGVWLGLWWAYLLQAAWLAFWVYVLARGEMFIFEPKPEERQLFSWENDFLYWTLVCACLSWIYEVASKGLQLRRRPPVEDEVLPPFRLDGCEGA